MPLVNTALAPQARRRLWFVIALVIGLTTTGYLLYYYRCSVNGRWCPDNITGSKNLWSQPSQRHTIAGNVTTCLTSYDSPHCQTVLVDADIYTLVPNSRASSSCFALEITSLHSGDQGAEDLTSRLVVRARLPPNSSATALQDDWLGRHFHVCLDPHAPGTDKSIAQLWTPTGGDRQIAAMMVNVVRALTPDLRSATFNGGYLATARVAHAPQGLRELKAQREEDMPFPYAAAVHTRVAEVRSSSDGYTTVVEVQGAFTANGVSDGMDKAAKASNEVRYRATVSADGEWVSSAQVTSAFSIGGAAGSDFTQQDSGADASVSLSFITTVAISVGAPRVMTQVDYQRLHAVQLLPSPAADRYSQVSASELLVAERNAAGADVNASSLAPSTAGSPTNATSSFSSTQAMAQQLQQQHLQLRSTNGHLELQGDPWVDNGIAIIQPGYQAPPCDRISQTEAMRLLKSVGGITVSTLCPETVTDPRSRSPISGQHNGKTSPLASCNKSSYNPCISLHNVCRHTIEGLVSVRAWLNKAPEARSEEMIISGGSERCPHSRGRPNVGKPTHFAGFQADVRPSPVLDPYLNGTKRISGVGFRSVPCGDLERRDSTACATDINGALWVRGGSPPLWNVQSSLAPISTRKDTSSVTVFGQTFSGSQLIEVTPRPDGVVKVHVTTYIGSVEVYNAYHSFMGTKVTNLLYKTEDNVVLAAPVATQAQVQVHERALTPMSVVTTQGSVPIGPRICWPVAFGLAICFQFQAFADFSESVVREAVSLAAIGLSWTPSMNAGAGVNACLGAYIGEICVRAAVKLINVALPLTLTARLAEKSVCALAKIDGQLLQVDVVPYYRLQSCRFEWCCSVRCKLGSENRVGSWSSDGVAVKEDLFSGCI